MTAYRVDEFQEEDEEDIDSIEQEAEPKEIQAIQEDIMDKPVGDDASVLTEILEAKPADTTHKKVEQLEVKADKLVFKTKCQLMQEDSENGKNLGFCEKYTLIRRSII